MGCTQTWRDYEVKNEFVELLFQDRYKQYFQKSFTLLCLKTALQKYQLLRQDNHTDIIIMPAFML